jgi:hypothetical protein
MLVDFEGTEKMSGRERLDGLGKKYRMGKGFVKGRKTFGIEVEEVVEEAGSMQKELNMGEGQKEKGREAEELVTLSIANRG